MPRYFIEVAYDGTGYGGFQIQKNAVTIQSEVNRALELFYRIPFELTCSSRTDAGVHARQNYFHFDIEHAMADADKNIYNLNAILPAGIVIRHIFRVRNDAHCRFDALSREYRYFIYDKKDPFIRNTAFYFPYKIDLDKMNEAAEMLKDYSDFTSFSKKKTQVKTFNCRIEKSEWEMTDNMVIYHVMANRFLRGMVKGLVGTMLRVGRDALTIEGFKKIIESKDCSLADFSVPSRGLFLMNVHLDDNVYP